MIDDEELKWFRRQACQDPDPKYDWVRGLEWKELVDFVQQDPTIAYIPFPHQQRFHESPANKRVLWGANQIGKSRCCIIEDIWMALGTHPYRHCSPGDGFLVYVNHDHFRQVIQQDLLSWAPEDSWEYIKNDRVILWKDGHGKIVSRTWLKAWKDDKHAESKFEGSKINWAHFDEECPWPVIQATNLRLISRRGKWHMAMTPILGVTPLKKQIDGADGKRMFVVHADMDANPRLTPDARDEYLGDIDEHERLIRELGVWMPRQKTVFDAVLMEARKRKCPKYIDEGEFPDEGWRWQSRPGNGAIRIWEYPVPGALYRIGADVAQGEGGADSSGVVLRLTPDGIRQVATFKSNTHDEHRFAHQLAALGRWYNMAWLCPEVTALGRALLLPLADSRSRNTFYPRIYKRIFTDQRDQRSPTKKLGWYTSAATRPILLGYIKEAVEHDPPFIVDPRIFEQAQTFIRHKVTGVPAAAQGCLDDLLFGAALAMACVQRYPYAVVEDTDIEWRRGYGGVESPEWYGSGESNPCDELDFEELKKTW